MIKTGQFTLFDGKLALSQPEQGYRVAIDPVFLAAAVSSEQFENARILDMGCGVGTIGFCLLSRFSCSVTGVDIQKDYIALAQQNAKDLGQSEHCQFVAADLKSWTADALFDVVVTNPPYMAEGTCSENEAKNRANKETIPFSDWMDTGYRALKKGGYLFMVHRTDRLHELLVTLQDKDFGSFEIYPLWPRAGQASKRMIIKARKMKYAPLIMHSGLVLHEGDMYTSVARHVLYDGQGLSF